MMQSQNLEDGPRAKVVALRRRHAEIETRIHEARQSPSTTADYLNMLKKKKLVLKDAIEKISYAEH